MSIDFIVRVLFVAVSLNIVLTAWVLIISIRCDFKFDELIFLSKYNNTKVSHDKGKEVKNE